MDKHEPTQRKYSVADTTSAGGVNPLLNRPWTFNPRHLRVRLRWVGFSSKSSAIHTAPATEPLGGKTTILALPQVFQLFDPRKLRVRVTWIGFGSMGTTLQSASTSAQVVERVTTPSLGRVLGTFDMPRIRLRVRWLGPGSMNRRSTWMLGLLAVLLIIFAFTRFTHENDTNFALGTEKAVPAGLIADDISLGNETIRMIHSPIDIGQSKDVFDHDLETLMRGREANPFILDLQLSQPQAIKGLVMDFGRMNFVMRVQVYGAESTKPIFYQGEYRQQPPIPHVDMDFAGGPEQVRRIYIEIEQLDPPDDVHIHVREIVFKE